MLDVLVPSLRLIISGYLLPAEFSAVWAYIPFLSHLYRGCSDFQTVVNDPKRTTSAICIYTSSHQGLHSHVRFTNAQVSAPSLTDIQAQAEQAHGKSAIQPRKGASNERFAVGLLRKGGLYP